MSNWNIRSEVKDVTEDLIAIRRDLHRHPELGMQETRTARLVADKLREYGLEQITEGVAQTGVVGLIQGAAPGPTVLVRADMDGLPLQEENRTDYASTVPNVMHACGHDGHVSIGLQVARLLNARKSNLAGTVKMVFQPAEEGPGGALPMIQAGVMREPKVDVALGLHMWNAFPLGHIGIQNGPMLACADQFYLTIDGRGGHGAEPHKTVDPVVTAAHVITALQTIASRKVDPFRSVVVTVGAIHGGKAPNIIPQRVELCGTVRTMEPELHEHLPGYLERIIRGITDAMGATYEYRYVHGYPATVNDPRVCDMVRECAREALGSNGLVTPVQTMGGEDMSYFLREVPGCFFFVGSSNAERGLNFPHHSPRFDFDEAALPLGTEIMLRAVDAALAGRWTGQPKMAAAL